MFNHRQSTILSLLTLLALFVVSPARPQDASTTVAEWVFDTDGDLRGWTPSGHLKDCAVAGGSLHGEATDWDPILMGPTFEIEATPTQCVEIRMKATETDGAELFWTETLQGEHGGFSQQKHNTFDVVGDGRFHVYRIHPFWHAAKRIVRLRFDPPGSGPFEIASIRIVDQRDNRQGAASTATAWSFDTETLGWRAWRDMNEPTVRDGALALTSLGGTSMLMSPTVNLPADDLPIVCVRMAVSAGSSGAIVCVCDGQFGSEKLTFPLRSDGRMHSYNVEMSPAARWRGRVILLGLQPTDATGAEVRVESIQVADEPRGPAELEVAYFGRAEGVNRTGRPVEVTCLVRNLGGETAGQVTATLLAPPGVEILGPATVEVEPVSIYRPKQVTWQIRSSEAALTRLIVRLAVDGTKMAEAAAEIEFSRPPQLAGQSYVPEPRPVKSPFDIGAFYFPGWHDMTRWQPILNFPNRKPVLGWYDESLAEVADWQIKWAVEHGVTFFMVDWYWSEGNRHLEHWLHGAYQNARYRKYLQWCVMWANHNRPGTHSVEDWRKVTQYWIDNYFGMEEYYQIDGRPAVYIWSPDNIRRDLGGTEEAAKLYRMSQEMARAAGYKGIYFVAMFSHQSESACLRLRDEGYEAFTSYHGFGLAERQAQSTRFPFERVVDTAREVWERDDRQSAGLLTMPIVDTGWDSQPWHGAKARSISGRTPELFGRLCREARDYALATDKPIITIGPINEWGEGSYIEPYAEYGFQDLDQLRAAFCGPGDYPPNVIPSDVGLGPYDLPPLEIATAWEFDAAGGSQGWSPNGGLTVRIADGLLEGETSGADPILVVGAVELEAAMFGRLVVRMRADADVTCQLFWGTTTAAQSEATSVRFDVVGDGRFHDYKIDLGSHRAWRGLVTSLRFDPASKPGVQFAIDYFRLR